MLSMTRIKMTPAGKPAGRLRRAALAAVALTGLFLFASACSSGSQSPGVPGAAGTYSATAPNSANDGSSMHNAAAYASCMRSHGVPNFPDPTSQGTFQITSNDGININSPQYQNAMKSCQSLAPAFGGIPAQNKAAALKYASCMRSHGVANFPDPNAGGGFEIGGNSGIDPSTPQYQSAQEACQHYLPGAGGSTITSSGGGL